MMPANRLISVRVDGLEIEAEAVLEAGTESMAGAGSRRRPGEVTDAFSRAEDAVVAFARSTAQMIERAGAAARPDRVEVEFGLKFSASGGVILAGVAGEASLAVTSAMTSPPGLPRRFLFPLRRPTPRLTRSRPLAARPGAGLPEPLG